MAIESLCDLAPGSPAPSLALATSNVCSYHSDLSAALSRKHVLSCPEVSLIPRHVALLPRIPSCLHSGQLTSVVFGNLNIVWDHSCLSPYSWCPYLPGSWLHPHLCMHSVDRILLRYNRDQYVLTQPCCGLLEDRDFVWVLGTPTF